jgi:hypothetical protein
MDADLWRDGRPAMLRDGNLRKLPVIDPDERGVAEAISDTGTIAGWFSATPENVASRYPVIWRGC